jgi:hypothetical protein
VAGWATENVLEAVKRQNAFDLAGILIEIALSTSTKPFEARWLLSVPCTTPKKFYVLLHSVFMYFVWIGEQTAIISLYNPDCFL